MGICRFTMRLWILWLTLLGSALAQSVDARGDYTLDGISGNLYWEVVGPSGLDLHYQLKGYEEGAKVGASPLFLHLPRGTVFDESSIMKDNKGQAWFYSLAGLVVIPPGGVTFKGPGLKSTENGKKPGWFYVERPNSPYGLK